MKKVYISPFLTIEEVELESIIAVSDLTGKQQESSFNVTFSEDVYNEGELNSKGRGDDWGDLW